MSLLIKGIDLPKDAQAVQISYWTKDGHYITESYPPSQIVEIPKPHGRLIDASELIKSYMKGTKTDIDDFYDTIDIIDNAPTILEAEE